MGKKLKKYQKIGEVKPPKTPYQKYVEKYKNSRSLHDPFEPVSFDTIPANRGRWVNPGFSSDSPRARQTADLYDASGIKRKGGSVVKAKTSKKKK